MRAIAFTSWSIRLRVYSETRRQEFDYRRHELVARRWEVGIESEVLSSVEAERWFCPSDGALGNNPAGLVSDFAENSNSGKCAHRKLSHPRGAVGTNGNRLGTNYRRTGVKQAEQRVRKSLRSKDGPIQSWAHNPKVVGSNPTP